MNSQLMIRSLIQGEGEFWQIDDTQPITGEWLPTAGKRLRDANVDEDEADLRAVEERRHEPSRPLSKVIEDLSIEG